jgi:hypothetical protein
MSGTNDDDEDERRDRAVEETFPASDPPQHGGSTGPNDGRKPREEQVNPDG